MVQLVKAYVFASSSSSLIMSSHFIHSKTAATSQLPIERELKTDLVSVLAVYQLQYSNIVPIDKGDMA